MKYYIVAEQGHSARRYRAEYDRHAVEIHARRRHGRRAAVMRRWHGPDAHIMGGGWYAYVPTTDGGRSWRGNRCRVILDPKQVPHAERGDLSDYDW